MVEKVENRQILRSVPADHVDKVVSQFEAEGAVSVKVRNEPDGTYTIEAIMSE